MTTIDQRAADALSALYEHLSVKGELTIKPVESMHIASLVTDLLHLAEQNGFSPGEIAAGALRNFEIAAVEQPPADYPVCAACGSEEIALDVIAHWDKVAGEAYVADICENGHSCEQCGTEVSIEWIRPVPRGP